MKKLFTIALLFCFYYLNAQSLQIGAGQVKHEKQMRPCIEVALSPSPDKVKDDWEAYLKKEYKVKLKGYGFLTNKDVLSAEEVKFKAVSDKKMDFFTRIVEEDGKTKMYVFGSFGYDIFINEKGFPVEYKRLEDITKRFLNGFLTDFYSKEIKASQGALEDLRKEKANMEKEREENEKEIEKLKQRNEELAKQLPDKNKTIEESAQMLQSKESNWSEVKSTLSSFNIKKD